MTNSIHAEMSREEAIARKLCRWRCLTTHACNSKRESCGQPDDPCQLWGNRLGLAKQIIKEVENFGNMEAIDTSRYI